MPIISIKIVIKSFESSTLKSTQALIKRACLSVAGKVHPNPLANLTETGPGHSPTMRAPSKVLGVDLQGPSLLARTGGQLLYPTPRDDGYARPSRHLEQPGSSGDSEATLQQGSYDAPSSLPLRSGTGDIPRSLRREDLPSTLDKPPRSRLIPRRGFGQGCALNDDATPRISEATPRISEATPRISEATPRISEDTSTQLSNVALPRSKKIFTLLRSPHIDKKSREQFQLQTHRCRIDISLRCKGEASLLLFLLRNSELPGTQLRIDVTSSTPLFR
jgi:ribosomal protein S10